MKRCRTCHPPTMKPLSEFSLEANRPDGHRSQCKQCANKNTARYLSDHPGYAKTYHEKNKEEIARKYRECSIHSSRRRQTIRTITTITL
jgi:hypothetical protein